MYTDWADALASVIDGGTIEVIHDGPHSVSGAHIAGKDIAVKAVDGRRPVFVTASDDGISPVPFLSTSSDLTLHGLEIEWQMQAPTVGAERRRRVAENCAVVVEDGSLSISNCRLDGGGMTGCVGVTGGSLSIRASYLSSDQAPCLAWEGGTEQTDADLRRCIWDGRIAVYWDPLGSVPDHGPMRLELRRNTLLTRRALQLVRPRRRVFVHAERNAFDVADVLVVTDTRQRMHKVRDRKDAVRLLRTLVAWTEVENAYRRGISYFARGVTRINQPTRTEIDSLGDWTLLWKGDGSVEAEFDYETAEHGQGAPPRWMAIRAGADPYIDRVGGETSTDTPATP